MTLEKIRAALPTHIMLTPGARLKPGDEIWQHTSPVTGVWKAAFIEGCVNSRPFRRPIPPHILDSQAWWMWYDLLEANIRTGLKTRIINMALSQPEYKAGRLYDKWLLEQMEDV